MTGTQPTQFDGHLAEVTWSPEARGRMFLAFFDLLRLVYTLQGPEYRHITSLSDSWTMEPDAATPIVEWRIMPADSNAESKLSSQSSMRDNLPTEIIRRSDDRYIWPNQWPGCPTVVNSTSVASNTITESQIAAMFSSLSWDDGADTNLVIHLSRRMRFSTIWHFDKGRLGRASAASF